MSIPSPITLTPEQQQMAFLKKREAFMRDYEELEKKHGLGITAVLINNNFAIIAVPKVVPLAEKQAAQQDSKTSSVSQ